MATATQAKELSFADFEAMVRPDQKADLINGEIIMASPESPDNNDLLVWVLRLLADYVELHLLGKVFGSRVAFRLDGTNGPEPDIAFLQAARLHLIRKGYVAGPPDLAMEIVSPESEDRDYQKKRLQYQRAGIAEYWIIDMQSRRVTLYRLDRRGRYRAVRAKSGRFVSQVVTGFWLRPEWLWPESRPTKAEALSQILS
jgi:Uma2 family endonuclease